MLPVESVLKVLFNETKAFIITIPNSFEDLN